MKTLLHKYSIASLFILSLVCGLLWRLEVEYHGWAGLIWISYFHWAIPVAFGLFLVWGNAYIELSIPKRLLMNSIAIALGMGIYSVFLRSLYYNCMGGPSGFITLIMTPEWQYKLWQYAILFIIPSMPLSIFLLMRLFGHRIEVKRLIFAIIGLLLAIPLSIWLLDLIHHKGGGDLAHIIKSGMLIPFWVFALGWVVIGKKQIQ